MSSQFASCSPDQLVDHILEEIVYSGYSGITIDHLWELSSNKLNRNLSPSFKQLIWKWLIQENNFEVFHTLTNKNIPKHDLSVINISNLNVLFSKFDKDTLLLKTNQNFQFKTLTNQDQNQTSIGLNAFIILCAIAKSRHHGLLVTDIPKVTGQDNRCLTSRINSLLDQDLIVKIPVLHAKRSTGLLVYKKFIGLYKYHQSIINNNITNPNQLANIHDHKPSTDSTNPFLNPESARKLILNSVKNAPNKLRNVKDLKSQLAQNNIKYDKKIFKSVINYLANHGYIKKVKAKFFTNAISNTTLNTTTDIENDNDNDNGNNNNDIDVTSEISIITKTIKFPLINTVFPVQNQLFQIIDLSKNIGISTQLVQKLLVGLNYARIFNKLLEIFSDSFPDYNSNTPFTINDFFKLTRGYDFNGRTKFFRYFTKINYSILNNNLNPLNYNQINKSALISQKSSYISSSIYDIHQLQSQNNTLLAKGKITPSDDSPKIKRKRGRPRKSDTNAKKSNNNEMLYNDVVSLYNTISNNNENLSYDISKNEVILISNDSSDNSQNSVSIVTNGISKETIINIDSSVSDNFPPPRRRVRAVRTSFLATKRRNTLLNLIKNNKGMIIVNKSVIDYLSESIKGKSAVDRRTLHRDIKYLEEEGKIAVENFKVITQSNESFDKKIIMFSELRNDVSRINQMKELAQIEYDEQKITKKYQLNTVDANVTLFTKEGEDQVRIKKEKVKKVLSKEEKERLFLERLEAKRLAKLKKIEEMEIKKNESRKTQTGNNEVSKKLSLEGKKKVKFSRRKTLSLRTVASDPNIINKRRTRTKFDFTKTEAITFFRAVTITRTLSPAGKILWGKIADYFGDITPELIKKKWPKIRGVIGEKGTKKALIVWERILFNAIKNREVSSKDIREMNLAKFIGIWKNVEGTELPGIEKFEFFKEIEDNLKKYVFIPENRHSSMVDEYFADRNSGKEKEKEDDNDNDNDYDLDIIDETEKRKILVKQTIKAIFATDAKNYTIEASKRILKRFSEKECTEAIKDMDQRKEIIFQIKPGLPNFVLTSKVLNPIDSLKFEESFFHESKLFNQLLCEVLNSSQGLILSPAVTNGTMACLLDLSVLLNKVKMVRVDKHVTPLLTDYISRAIDREKLDCDIIICKNKERAVMERDILPVVAVPIGKPCSRIWIDVQGNINRSVWVRVLVVVVSLLLFRPGIWFKVLFGKIELLVTKEELKEVLGWMVQRNCVKERKLNGGSCYWLKPGWFDILG
ncbi:transcription factor TFIIIC subunit TFC3 ASCRUDRAFT_32229 [Ascoidea rubescens DSM 1968]|uniref:Uncharacterized protein n=1 Tax=Ascoidea rubescens DSM 1968 TaxID=1344418 RepID=A0A1D2VLB7_9ASCO|nr:hypothetical protein ASCRUDRAFT_32229 [Ascoidea rubescens DSM 1968]ODV62374.1 hypothetical protein ASCRUDRAFT_32229 [Ascoidea rubescens DSM 1968]